MQVQHSHGVLARGALCPLGLCFSSGGAEDEEALCLYSFATEKDATVFHNLYRWISSCIPSTESLFEGKSTVSDDRRTVKVTGMVFSHTYPYTHTLSICLSLYKSSALALVL